MYIYSNKFAIFVLAYFVLVCSCEQTDDEDDDEIRLPRPSRWSSESQPSDQAGWDEIFAEEYRQLMERENRAPELNSDDESNEAYSGRLELDGDWKMDDLDVGEIAGLSTDESNQLNILHRGSRTWTPKSFNRANVFVERNKGAIKEAAVVVLRYSNGSVVRRWGENTFYLPHGIQVDDKGNTWITDVAMHQVFKYEPGASTPSLKLGRAFEPAKSNEDDERFCKPTDVAVATDGCFYVADGYCNSRILKYSSEGSLIGKFAVGDANVAHSLALAEDLDLICLADREGMRILCYKAGLQDAALLGQPVKEFSSDIIGRVYAITYSKKDGVLYGITGQTGILVSQGFTVDLKDDDRYKSDIIAYWSVHDRGFDNPHDLTVTSDGEMVFVCELNPHVIWKFRRGE